MPIDINHLPRRLIPYPPDWSVAEVANIERTHAYESSRALGHLFRDFALPKREDLDKAMRGDECATFEDNVSRRLQSRIKRLAGKPGPMKDEPEWLLKIFCHYAAELRFICATHTLSNGAARLSEEEVVVGTILAQCSQRRWRKDRTQRMKTHSRVLVRAVELAILGAGDGIGAGTATRAQLRSGLGRAWNAWCYAARHRADEGAQSFGLIALGVMFACIEHIEEPGKVTPE
jgi:RNA-dependent RNA polymerase